MIYVEYVKEDTDVAALVLRVQNRVNDILAKTGAVQVRVIGRADLDPALMDIDRQTGALSFLSVPQPGSRVVILY